MASRLNPLYHAGVADPVYPNAGDNCPLVNELYAALLVADAIIKGHLSGAVPIGQFDAVLTDPPYQTTSLRWDRWVDGWTHDATKLGPVLWSFLSMKTAFARASEFAHWQFAQDLVWKKQNGSNFVNDRYKRVHEHMIMFYAGTWASIYKCPQFSMDATAKTVRRKTRPPHMGHIEDGHYTSLDGGPRLKTSVLNIRNCHGRAIHPTEKPVESWQEMIRYSVPPLGRFVDIFCGSASSLIAARIEGRRAIGIEINPEYAKLAVARLKAGNT